MQFQNSLSLKILISKNFIEMTTGFIAVPYSAHTPVQKLENHIFISINCL